MFGKDGFWKRSVHELLTFSLSEPSYHHSYSELHWDLFAIICLFMLHSSEKIGGKLRSHDSSVMNISQFLNEDAGLFCWCLPSTTTLQEFIKNPADFSFRLHKFTTFKLTLLSPLFSNTCNSYNFSIKSTSIGFF